MEIWCSQLCENDEGGDEEHTTYWLFNNALLISVVPMNKPGDGFLFSSHF